VTACWMEAITFGTLTGGPALDPATMFEDVLKQMPPHLARQREELRALRALGVKKDQPPKESQDEPTHSIAKEG
jgi:hypothetical protein